MADVINASDCKCCKCGNQAVAFWPAFDPDIRSYPYCREDLDKAKNELLLMMYDQMRDKPSRSGR